MAAMAVKEAAKNVAEHIYHDCINGSGKGKGKGKGKGSMSVSLIVVCTKEALEEQIKKHFQRLIDIEDAHITTEAAENTQISVHGQKYDFTIQWSQKS